MTGRAATTAANARLGASLIAGQAGLTEDVASATRTEILSMLWRLPVVAARAGLIGGAPALLLRHTSAVLGVLVAYAVAAAPRLSALPRARPSCSWSES